MKEPLILKFGKYKVNLQTLVFILGITGIILIGLSSILPRGEKEPEGTGVLETDAKVYTAELESRLQDILEQMEGVGQARVMVTLENGYQKVYAKSEKVNNDILEDIRAQDERKTQEKQVTEQTYILVDGAGGEEPLVTAELEPEVKGVVVVCEGGDRADVVGKVVDTVKVALDISSARISVSKLTVK
jgi:stage III sporulation protein AG